MDYIVPVLKRDGGVITNISLAGKELNFIGEELSDDIESSKWKRVKKEEEIHKQNIPTLLERRAGVPRPSIPFSALTCTASQRGPVFGGEGGERL